jgi:hypothetical protein
MTKRTPLGNYESSYDKHVKKITHLQRLLAIEELKLFELMQTKEKIVSSTISEKYFR